MQRDVTVCFKADMGSNEDTGIFDTIFQYTLCIGIRYQLLQIKVLMHRKYIFRVFCILTKLNIQKKNLPQICKLL